MDAVENIPQVKMIRAKPREKITDWLSQMMIRQRENEGKNKNDITEFEIEIRFKEYRLGAFQYGVSYKDFNRLRTFMNGNYKLLSIIHQTDLSQNIISRTGIKLKIRRTIIKGEPDLWIAKSKKEKVDDAVYNLRYAFNYERIISSQFRSKFLPKFEADIRRVKTRWSYYMNSGKLRVDLTEVKETNAKQQLTLSYEVELEVVKAKGLTLDVLSDAISMIFKVLHDTEYIYTINEYKNLVNYVNGTFGYKSPDRNFPVISHWGLYQARNLHYKDMVTGGLIAHSTFQKNNSTTLTYSVTIKADGIRKLLVISPIGEYQIGIWLVMSKNKVNLISRYGRGKFDDKVGYILEGELIPKNRRKDGAPTQKYWYLVYDCLAIPDKDVLRSKTIRGNTIIQERHHSYRMEMGQLLVRHLQNDRLLLAISKDFRGFNTGRQLFKIIRDLTLTQSGEYYENDGFMFTPEEMPYNFKIEGQYYGKNIWSLPLHKRVLTKYPDICKWKPPKDLTIDFQIKHKPLRSGGSMIELFVGLPKNEGFLGLFTGTNNYPFPIDQGGNVELAIKGSIVNGLPDGTIVEYKWDYSKRLMIPMRIRSDKQRPNLKQFADDTWDLIQNPITLDTIKGEDFKLMFKYHNRIKRNLFETAYRSLKSRNGQGSLLTALDIGSGPGGDTSKLIKFDRIIFLEPTISYLPELSSRIRNAYRQANVEILTNDNFQSKINISLGRGDKAIILNTGGENSGLIKKVVDGWAGGPVSLISIMLSMSFFWSSPQKIKALETTIVENLSPAGEGIFFTIDGELVRHAFNPIVLSNKIKMGGQVDDIDVARFGGANLDYDEKLSKLVISIPYSLVDRQTEYPPYLADLELGLKLKGWKISHLERADQELFLNPGETELSKLYMSGRILPKNFIEKKVAKVIRRTPKKKNRKERGPVQRRVSINPPQICTPTRTIPTISLVKVILPPKPGPIKIIIKPVKSRHLPMISLDDKVEQIIVPWYRTHPVVRIGTIGDGSCFFHAALKAFYSPYANNNNRAFRIGLVRKLRRDIAASLEIKDPKSADGKTFYQTAARGSWVRLSVQQRLGIDLGFDPSLLAMQTLLNSKKDVGNEVYQFVGDLLGINIYVMKASQNNLEPILNTSTAGIYQPSVIIAGNDLHYETIGIYSGPKVGIQTIFYPNDPFLIALRGQIHDEGGDKS